MRLLSLTELPLFRRELTELAQRRRTYIVRVVGALVLAAAAMWMVDNVLAQRGRTIGIRAILGSGGAVFRQVVGMLFYVIPVLMPALCCTSITSEKEQNTLGTLLLTRLSPGMILIEKLFSRVVPMFTLLLLVSPVLAYAYSLGGVDTGQLFGAIWLLFCECVLFASVAILFSAWFPTSVSAFVWSYIVTVLLVVFSQVYPVTAAAQWDRGLGVQGLPLAARISIMGGPAGMVTMAGASGLLLQFFKGSLVPLSVAAVVLLLARFVFVRRAFAGSSSLLLRVFRRMDTFFRNLNDWTTGGIEIAGESNALPEYDPVTWRERNKKSLGQVRWLVRVLVAIEGPTLFICAFVVIVEPNQAAGAIYPLLILLWVFAAMLAAVKGASLFAQERSRQTLEALLSSPLTSHELLTQKVRGTNRLLLVLACPLLTANLTQVFLHDSNGFQRVVIYMGVVILLAFLLLRTVTWLTTGIGIWIHSQNRAILVSIGAVVLWATLPLAVFQIAVYFVPVGNANLWGQEAWAQVMYNGFSACAPGSIAAAEFFLTETSAWSDPLAWRGRYGETGLVPAIRPLVFGVVCQLFGLWLVRTVVLRLAPRLLNRRDRGTIPQPQPVTAGDQQYA